MNEDTRMNTPGWAVWEEREFSLETQWRGVSIRLDGDGFRCGGRFVPLEQLRFFWVMPVKAGRRPRLIMRTDGLPVTIFGGWRRNTADVADIRRLAGVGNRVLARLKGRKNIPESDGELRLRLKDKPEVVSLDEESSWRPAERTPMPAGTKWRMTETPEGVMFRQGNRTVRMGILWLTAIALAAAVLAFGAWLAWYWYTVVCGEYVPAEMLFVHLGRLVPAAGMCAVFVAACFVAVFVYRQAAWCCRWTYFGLENGTFLSGDSLWGNAREDSAPVAKCAELAVFDDDELALTGPPGARRKAGYMPTYVVQTSRRDGGVLTEVAGLTRDEARWMRDEIMDKLG